MDMKILQVYCVETRMGDTFVKVLFKGVPYSKVAASLE